MTGDGFRSVRLKEPLLNAIENFIREHPEMGYKGIADFLTDAAREKLLELNAQLAAQAAGAREVVSDAQ